MDNSRFNKKAFVKRIITTVALAVFIFLILLLADHPRFIERYYSQGLYPMICHILHPVFNLFPFSIGDFVYVAVSCYLIYAVIHLIKLLFKKQWKQSGFFVMGLVIGLQTAILIFYIFWGINYFRPSAGERLNLRDTNYTTPHLIAVTGVLIDSANTCRARITPADLKQDNAAIYQTAINAVTKLSADSIDFRTYKPGIKPSLLTPFMNYLGTSGYYNPFTGEAQLNYEAPYFERPLIACHEMSHQMGYGLEDEADFAGFLAGVGSKDRLLRYSAYQLAVSECMHALRYRDTTASNEMKKHISMLVRKDFIAQRLYWMKYRGKIELVSSIFYNDFLKVNNQPHGLGTYDQMVLLLMAWYRL